MHIWYKWGKKNVGEYSNPETLADHHHHHHLVDADPAIFFIDSIIRVGFPLLIARQASNKAIVTPRRRS